MIPEENWDPNEDSDLEDSEIANLGSNREMALRVKYPVRNVVPWYLHMVLFLVVFPVIAHAVVFEFEASNVPVSFLRLVFSCFSVSLAFCISSLLRWTNEGSISGMVAQRHNRISYITILLIMHLTTYTSSLFLVYGVRQWVVSLNRYQTLKFFLGFISPLLCSVILIIPLTVFKKKEEIGFEPMKKNKYGYYRKRFYLCNTDLIDRMHTLTVFSGVTTGYITVMINLFHVSYSYHCSLGIYYMVISSLCLLSFGCWKTYDSELSVLKKQIRLLLEFVGFYYYIAALILVLVTNKDLIEAK